MKKYGLIAVSIAIVALILFFATLPASAVQRRDDTFGDPIGNYHFRVEIEGVDAGQFTSVDGLSIEQEVIEYQNGDDPLTYKRPGRVAYSEITLRKNYTSESQLNDWIEAARFGNGEYMRKNMSIVLSDQSGQEIKRWNCFDCFPKSWKLSSLDGKGNDVLTEEIVIVIEWFEEA